MFNELTTLLLEHPIFSFGLLLMAGYGAGKLVGRVGLPEISGYIIAGIVVGHSFPDMYPEIMGQPFTLVTEIALSLVALTIGAEFSFAKLRHIGRDIAIIALVQIAIVFAVVGGALWLVGMGLPFALLLGVIATATEPAATVAEVHALRARGRFVDYLFGTVALDDAVCVLAFSVTLALITRFLYADRIADTVALYQVLRALMEIGFSLLLGVFSGWILHRATKRRKGSNEIFIVTIGILFMTTATAVVLHLSPLLANLAMGSVLVNMSARNHRILRTLEPLTPPVYALFFTIAGIKLDFQVMADPMLLTMGAVYLGSRAISKYGGIYLGCRLRDVPAPFRRNLGWCMFPQGGIALGLILLAQSSPLILRIDSALVQETLSRLLNIVLISVIISELVGPPLIRMGIQRGCMDTEEDTQNKTVNKAPAT